MSIDWSKAPEGATHWEPTGHDFYEGWMKKEGNDWFFWGEESEEWRYGGDVSAEREATFEARPQDAWDGQGLPPAGAKCLTDRNDFLREVTILCHGKTRTFVFDHVSQEEICLVLKDRVFLPIRTPEQIAAEEREKAVGDMAMSIQGVPYQYPTLYALYDAGYRRQESST
ncbi:hypothetical protein IPC1291_19870 [Pseudomonas aeruginosa]|uniref:hypothetical protein n=1 Tax=Pseudomonas aeruginosa TaxID=287 RepID=UPI000F51F203|nr:hypothetical protein [Pseudomonas aeruginosa]RPM47404.1 hypothetical protein IPC1291_19870 [Pseudomonas aeruginosa]